MPKTVRKNNITPITLGYIALMLLLHLSYNYMSVHITNVYLLYWSNWLKTAIFVFLVIKWYRDIKNRYYNDLYTTKDVERLNLIHLGVTSIMIVAFVIINLSRVTVMRTNQTTYSDQQIYVTYNTSCPYCQKAKDEILFAISAAKLHNNNIQYVDMSETNELTDVLKTKADKVGRIIKGDQVTTYVEETTDGKPKDPDTQHLYNILLQLKGE